MNPELGVDEVPVQVHALALAVDDLELVGGVVASQVERSAGLDDPQHAHQPLGDAIALGDPPSQVLLGLARATGGGVLQVHEGTPRRLRRALSVHAQRLGRGLGPHRELGEGVAQVPQQDAHAPGVVEAHEVTLEDHPVEHRQAADHPAAVYRLKALHRRPSATLASESQECARDARRPSNERFSFRTDTWAQGRLRRPGTDLSSTGPASPRRLRPLPQHEPETRRGPLVAAEGCDRGDPRARGVDSWRRCASSGPGAGGWGRGDLGEDPLFGDALPGVKSSRRSWQEPDDRSAHASGARLYSPLPRLPRPRRSTIGEKSDRASRRPPWQ